MKLLPMQFYLNGQQDFKKPFKTLRLKGLIRRTKNTIYTVLLCGEIRNKFLRMFLDVAETIAGSLLCHGAGIAQCLFDLFY